MANIGYFNGTSSVLSNVDQIGFRAINFRQQTTTAVTKTNSGRVIRNSSATTLWVGTLDFIALTYQEFRQVQGFVALARGSLNDFYIELPNISNRTAGATSGTVTVLGDTTAGATSTDVSLGSWTNGTIINMGDFIKFSNHDKVYMATTDITPDSAGDVQLSFEPALVSDINASNTVSYDNVAFKMIFSNDLQEYRYNVDGTVSCRIDVEEVI